MAEEIDGLARLIKEKPADAALSAFFRDNHKLGQQDRHFIAESVFAVLRRHAGQSTNQWSVGALVVEPSQKRVTQDGQIIELTPREYQLLLELVRRAHRWVPRETLMDALYREGDSVSANALEVVIHHLRRKLGNETIQTIRGVGYMIGGNR